jgi:S1-C subfamily serine protease
MIETLNDQNRGEVFKGIDKGVVVKTIQADTPAAKSDLRPADVITEVDGTPIATAKELQREVLKKKVGDDVRLGVMRNGKKILVSVKTEELPGGSNRIAGTQPAPQPDQDLAGSYGLQIQDVTPELKQELGLKSDGGVVVTEVAPNSPAAVADIQPGDVITEVGRTPVADRQAFEKALVEQKGKPNLLLLLDRKGVKTYSIVKAGK